MAEESTMDRAAEFEEDPRYAIAWRELWIAVGYWLAFTIAVTGSAWLLGGGKDAGELTFVLGFPTWFFWSILVCSLVFSIVPYFLVKRWFTDVPLSPDGEPDRPTDGR